MSSKYAIRSAFQSSRSPFFTVSVWRIETTFLQSSKVVLQRVRSFLYDVFSFLYDVDLKLISPLTTTKHSSATCVKQRQTFALYNTSLSSTQIQFLLLLDRVTRKTSSDVLNLPISSLTYRLLHAKLLIDSIGKRKFLKYFVLEN